MADLFKDFVYTRSTVTIGPTDTVWTVEDVSLFPANTLLAKGDFYLVIESSLSYPNTFEIVKLTNVNTATKNLTVVRAQAGTFASSHPIATYIKAPLTSDMLRRIRAGYYGNSLPVIDSDIYNPGDQFWHLGEQRYYAYQPYAVPITEKFQRADSSTLGTTDNTSGYQGTWTTIRGAFQISSSTLKCSAVDSGSNDAMAGFSVGGNAGSDVDFSVYFTPGNVSNNVMGIFIGMTGDGKNGYLLQANCTQGTYVTLYRIQNGTSTQISQQYASYFYQNQQSQFRIRMVGNVVTWWWNGGQNFSGTVTDTTSPYLGTYVGVYASGSNFPAMNAWWTSLTVTNPTYTSGFGWQQVTDPVNVYPQKLTAVEGVLGVVAEQVDEVANTLNFYDKQLYTGEVAEMIQTLQIDELQDALSAVETRLNGLSETEIALSQVATQVDELLDVVNKPYNLRTLHADDSLAVNDWAIADVSVGTGHYNGYIVDTPSYTYPSGVSTFSTQVTTYVPAELIVALRGTWGSGTTTATLNGSAMTKVSTYTGGSQQTDVLVGTAALTGLQNVSITGPTGANVCDAIVLPIEYVTATGAVYVTSASDNISITTTVPSMLVWYMHLNGGTPPTITTAGGLLWTKQASGVSGSQNASAVYTAQAATPGTFALSLNDQGNSAYVNQQVMAFPFSGGIPSTDTFLSLPSTTSYGSIVVTNNDANGNPIYVVGTINGTTPTANKSTFYSIPNRYQTSVFYTDGTGSWYTLSGDKASSFVSGNWTWRGGYSSSTTYAANDVVYSGTAAASSTGALTWYRAPFSVYGWAPGSCLVPAPTSSTSGWALTGTATYSGTDLQLSALATSTAGGAWYQIPIQLDGYHASWQTEASGGTGADGFGFGLLDATIENAKTIGVNGVSGNGTTWGSSAGLNVQVEYYSSAPPYVKLVYAATHGGSGTVVSNISESTANLRGIHNWEIWAYKQSNGQYQITLNRDGIQEFQATTAAPDYVYVGFSGGNGGSTDNKYIRNYVCSYANSVWQQLKLAGGLDSWTAPTLLNSWANSNQGAGMYSPAGYYKDQNGRVHIRGMIAGGASGSTAFTLPAGYRPEFRVPAVTYGLNSTTPQACMIEVLTDGSVNVVTPGTTSTALDHVSFRAFS